MRRIRLIRRYLLPVSGERPCQWQASAADGRLASMELEDAAIIEWVHLKLTKGHGDAIPGHLRWVVLGTQLVRRPGCGCNPC